ncbi:MAG: Mur ligase family protein, partial [Pseudomonadota bacterium]
MIPVTAYDGQRVGVLGLGRSGLATAEALADGGATPVCWDDNEASREGVPFEVADLSREREAEGLAALIVSPGIPHLYPAPHPAVVRAQANGIPVDNDVGLFFRTLPELEPDDDPAPKVIAITGSNGKSTTTALVAHVLKHAGKPVQMGGNIGKGVLSLDPPGPGTIYVLELSSYQSDLARYLAPDIAVFLNLSADHLDRHGGLGGYFAAKRRLFEAGAPPTSIVGVEEVEGRALASVLENPVLVSTKERLRADGRSVFMNEAFLTEWRGKQLAAIDLRPALGLAGRHNHQNACAAYAACRAVGIPPRMIERALMTFPGLA